jgi:antitoxin PrlF
MKTIAVVSEKGQVTIPKTLRVALGITSGSRLEFREHEGGLLASRLVTRDPFEAMVGLGRGRDTDSVLSALRGPRRNRKTDGR